MDSISHTASPNVTVLKHIIPIKNSKEGRTLSVYIPQDYNEDSIHYPVFYFLDGQTIFDSKIAVGDGWDDTEWQVDEVLDSLYSTGHKAISVGIYNSHLRDKEYQPDFTLEKNDDRYTGDQHAEWIITEVIPWVNQKYRTSQNFIGGSSYGGLMSYYMLTEYPEVFSGAIIMSPSFWVNEKSTTLDQKVKNMDGLIIYLSAGEEERGIINGVRHLNDILVKRGLNENYKFNLEEDEIHRNKAWQKMVRKALPWVMERLKIKHNDASKIN